MTSNSSDLRLSASATAAGSSSLTLTIPAGQSLGTYFLQALSNVGSPTYTVNAPGYASKTGTITLAQSGVVIAGPFGFGAPLLTTMAMGDQPATVSTALLDASNNVIQTQQLVGGTSLAVSLSNSDSSVGTVAASVTITGGSDGVNTPFTPKKIGTTTISVTQPGGYATPASFTTLTAKVN
jgi:hypothetical protein